MGASIRHIDEEKCGVYSREAFIRGRRLFEGGVYSREAFIRVITVAFYGNDIGNKSGCFFSLSREQVCLV